MIVFFALLSLVLVIVTLFEEGAQDYDERQVYYRGRGYCFGFFAMMGWGTFYSLTTLLGDGEFLPGGVAMYIGVCLGSMVTICYAVWKGAGIPVRKRPWLRLLSYGFLSLIEGSRTWLVLTRELWTERPTSLIYPISFVRDITIFLVVWVRLAKDWQEAGEEPK